VKFEGFVGPSYAMSSLAADAQRAINLYPEIVESGSGKAKLVYRTTPGLTVWATLPQTPVRGLWSGGGRFLAVGGSKLYTVSSDGLIVTEKGDVGDDATHTPVTMDSNTAGEIFIVSAGNAYIYDGSTVASVPVPADPGVSALLPGGQDDTARTGTFIGQYFVAAKEGSKQFCLSGLNDGLTWDALDVAYKEGQADNISRVISTFEELAVLGYETSEFWSADGAADFPFRRLTMGAIPIGCGASWSAINLPGANGLAWLGSDTHGGPVAYRARGFQPERLSTHAIEQAWRGYSNWSDAISWGYTEDGHSFWVLTFPTGNATWVFDIATKLWHERAFWNGSSLERHRGRCHTYCFDKHLVGDHTSGKIYSMTQGQNTDDGTVIRRIRTAPHIADEDKQVAHYRFALDVDDASGNHTTCTLEWSNNNGASWSTGVVPSTNSALTGKLRRMVWRRLGMARDRLYRVTFNQNVAVAIIGAYLDLEGEA